jgi:ABC-type nitrate/sulfonate/bicarbonate transport system substrate-binding protein
MSTSKKQIRIGYAPLNDAAPLVMAHELGLFGELGLDVRLETSATRRALRNHPTLILAPISPSCAQFARKN